MKVYRVEHSEDRYGPYCTMGYPNYKRDALCWDMGWHHSGEEEHPPPHRDGVGLVFEGGDERHGFASASSLYDWFEGWLAQLDEVGFRMSTYRVARRHVRQGMHQLVFNINEAERLDTQRLVEVAA